MGNGRDDEPEPLAVDGAVEEARVIAGMESIIREQLRAQDPHFEKIVTLAGLDGNQCGVGFLVKFVSLAGNLPRSRLEISTSLVRLLRLMIAKGLLSQWVTLRDGRIVRMLDMAPDMTDWEILRILEADTPGAGNFPVFLSGRINALPDSPTAALNTQPSSAARDPDAAKPEPSATATDAEASGTTDVPAAIEPFSMGEWVDKIGAALRDHSWTCVFEVAAPMHPQLDCSVGEIEAAPEQLPDAAAEPGIDAVLDGRGVIVGVIDYGCDFSHPNFRTADGRSRVIRLWDQNGVPPLLPGGGEVPTGREFDPWHIDAALRKAGNGALPWAFDDDRPFWALDYDPHDNYYAGDAADGAHGTHVLDIAAGNGRAVRGNDRRPAGVAPGADILFVQVRKPVETVGREVLGIDRILEGVQYAFHEARVRGQDAVVNISLNTMAGPHDGSTVADRMLDALLGQPGRAIVIAAGNFAAAGTHLQDRVGAEGLDIPWRFPASDRTRNDLEIWYDGPAVLDVTVAAPAPRRIRPVTVKPGASAIIWHAGRPIGFVRNDSGRAAPKPDPGAEPEPDAEPESDAGSVDTRRNMILVSLQPFPPGQDAVDEEWTIGLRLTENAPSVARSVAVDAWIERDDCGQSRFPPERSTRRGTLGALGCGRLPLTVGAYYAAEPGRPAAHFSSEGPTRDGRQKPDLSAPGRSVRAAKSKGLRRRYPDNDRWRTAGTVAKDGTSMAAPHVAGAIALYLQRYPKATIKDIRQAFLSNARRQPPYRPGEGAEGWDPVYGRGRVTAAGAIRRPQAP